METERLKSALKEWSDMDVACYHVGLALDLFPEPSTFNKVRGLFFPAYPNANGELLLGIIDRLVNLGAVEYREDTSQYRWSPDFRGIQKVEDVDQ